MVLAISEYLAPAQFFGYGLAGVGNFECISYGVHRGDVDISKTTFPEDTAKFPPPAPPFKE
jgi:hypothetical protein